MNDPSRWSPDQDPPRDDALARLLRAAGAAPGGDVDWERLHAAVMRGAASTGGGVAVAARDWWDVVVQWRRLAAAASVAAILGAALLWDTGFGSSELVVGDDAAPESVAIARVVAAYPHDAMFTSLIQAARNDEFNSWRDQ